jgi:phage host-nuclease inhibitor protein Gam
VDQQVIQDFSREEMRLEQELNDEIRRKKYSCAPGEYQIWMDVNGYSSEEEQY